MNTIEVIPLISLGPIILGASRHDVKEICGPPLDYNPKTDFFLIAGTHFSVHYSEDVKVEYIEVSKPDDKDTVVNLKGVNVFWTPGKDLLEIIKSVLDVENDLDSSEAPYSYIFPGSQLSFWRPTAPEEYKDSDPEDEYEKGLYFRTIGIGVEDYYE